MTSISPCESVSLHLLVGPFHISRLYSKRDNANMKHELLSADELPRPGTMVSIDAEFVSMQDVRVMLLDDFMSC